MTAQQLIHSRLEAWFREFPQLLRQALQESEGLPVGWVWQEPFVPYFQRYETLSEQLLDLGLEPPRKAQIDHAISIIDFFEHPKTGESLLAYKVARLREWSKAFESWLRTLAA